MKMETLLLVFISIFFLSSFTGTSSDEKIPSTITRTLTLINGREVEKTIIVIDGTTSREDIIHTCNFLAHENVELTFEKLTIGKSFLGIVGKNRIRSAEGKIKLPNNLSQNFKAGGLTNFKSIKIQYVRNTESNQSQIEMIEIID